MTPPPPSQGYEKFMEDWTNDNQGERLHREFGINPTKVMEKYHLTEEEKKILLNIAKECTGKTPIELVKRINTLMLFKKPW